MRFVRPAVVLASLVAALLLWPAFAMAAPAITITPPKTPTDPTFTATLTGFDTGETITLQLGTVSSPPRMLDVPAVKIGADGTYTLAILPLGLAAGDYTLSALRGTAVVASARFTVVARATPTSVPVTPTRNAATPTRAPIAITPTPAILTPPASGTGGYLPGLPNTGGGAGATQASPPMLRFFPLILAAILVALGASLGRGGRQRTLAASRAVARLVKRDRHDGR